MAESAEPSLKIHVRWYHLIQIYTFNFECPLELIESENHYCLTGKEGEECCTDDFETFSRRFSKGCVDNCPYERDTTEWSWHILCRIRPEISPLKPDDKCDGADRGPFDDAIFYKDVQFDYCCSEDAFCGYGWLTKYWYWIVIVVVLGGIIAIVLYIVDKTCGSNEQAGIPIILFIDGKLIAFYPFLQQQQPTHQVIYVTQQVAPPPQHTIVINNNITQWEIDFQSKKKYLIWKLLSIKS